MILSLIRSVESAKRVIGPDCEKNLAMIQTMVGDNSRAISILTELLQMPCWSHRHHPAAITPVLLRLDPIWDPLRDDPAFQKLCEESQNNFTTDRTDNTDR